MGLEHAVEDCKKVCAVGHGLFISPGTFYIPLSRFIKIQSKKKPHEMEKRAPFSMSAFCLC